MSSTDGLIMRVLDCEQYSEDRESASPIDYLSFQPLVSLELPSTYPVISAACIRSRNGAPSRKGCRGNGPRTKASSNSLYLWNSRVRLPRSWYPRDSRMVLSFQLLVRFGLVRAQSFQLLIPLRLVGTPSSLLIVLPGLSIFKMAGTRKSITESR